MPFFVLPLRIILFSLFAFLCYRIGLFIAYSSYFAPLEGKEIATALLTGMQFDSATVMLFFSPMLILMSLPFGFIQQPSRLKVLAGLCGVVLIMMLGYSIGDLFYFGEVQRHIGAELLNLSADKAAVLDVALHSRLGESILGLLFLGVIGVAYYAVVLRPLKIAPKLPRHWVIKLLAWLGLVLLYVILFRGLILSSRPINLSDAFTGSKLPQANLALNPVYTSYREIRNRVKQQPLRYMSEKDLQHFVEKQPLVFQWQNAANTPTGKNVVLVLLESWSYKYIDSLSGSRYGATPFMDSLIAKSQVWDNFYAAGQRSILGIQAILSSVPVLPNQAALGFGLELNEMSRIADIANRYNYRTVMMQSSARRSFHMDSIANALGFQEYYGKEDVPLLRDYPQEQPRFGWDYDALQFFAKKLAESTASKPFFAFMFTGTTHEPFPKISNEFELYPFQAQGEQGFLNTLKYSDWAVQEFMREAAKQPWYKNTVFIFTADHTLNAAQGGNLQQNFHIPLIIFTPDGSLKPTRHAALGSQYDVFPTLMDLLGFNQSISTFGQSLLSDPPRQSVVVSQGNVSGMITPTNWLAFNEQGIVEQSAELSETEQKEFKLNKQKMQYADQLLRQNHWAEPKK